MPDEPCPPKEELTAFALGQIGEADAEPIARHLDQCVSCGETIDQLAESTDLVLARLRLPAKGRYAADSNCQQTLDRVKALGRDPTVADESTVPTGAADRTPPAAEVVRLRDYQLLEKLGEGGMGAVYKARHNKLDKIVALKMLPRERTRDQSAVARFEREMRAIGKLDHPHIVRATDAGEVDGMHYLVMEYVEGIDLAKLVNQRGPLPIAEACELIRQAAIGLDEANACGMVHRDIKPSNLMLCRPSAIRNPQSAMVKILDLGLALLSEAHAADSHGLTSSGQMMGTIDYMAPEQGGDSHVVDIRADIYSLGATLYKLLTGEAIYQGPQYPTPVKKLMALANQPAPPIQSRRSGIPNELAKIVHRMVEKSPSNRQATPKDVADALAPFCSGADLDALLERSPHAPPEENRAAQSPVIDHLSAPVAPSMSPLKLALARLVGIAAVLAAIIFFWQTPEGTVRIEINDPAITAQVDAKGVDIKKGDDQPIRVESGEHGVRIKHGDFEFETPKFVLKKGDEVTLQIEYLPGKIQVNKGGEPFFHREIAPVGVATSEPTLSERGIAEWVLKNGGTISVLKDDSVPSPVQSLDELPAGPIRVASISLVSTPACNDQALDSFHRLQHLRYLELSEVGVTEDGLARFLASPAAANLRDVNLQLGLNERALLNLSRLRQLQSIRLVGWKLTEKSLSELRDLPLADLYISNCTLEKDATRGLRAGKLVSVMLAWGPGVDDDSLLFLHDSTTLEQIDLGGSAVTDRGLEHLSANAGLANLDLRETNVTEAGLPHVLRFARLATLSLHTLPITDDGLAQLNALSELKTLNLAHTKVTDRGLAHLAQMKLEVLYLHDLPITDQGLEHLQKASTLQFVDAMHTKVSADGVKQLAAALPRCTIEWNQGKIEPKAPAPEQQP